MKKSLSRVTALALSALLAGMMLLTGCSGIAPSEYEEPAMTPTVDDSALITPGTLTVGIDCQNAPFAGQADGEYVGIDADVAAALADQMGLKVAYVDISTVGGSNALTTGMCDIFLSFDMATSSRTSSTYLGTYAYDAPSLFALSADGSPVSISAADVMGRTIAVQDNSVSDVAVTQMFGSGSAIGQAGLVDVFNALESGSTDYAAASGIVGKYLIKSTPYSDIVWACSLTGVPTEIGIGGNSANTQLNQAVQTALQTITDNGVLNLVLSKWIGSPLDFSVTLTAADAVAAETQAAAEAPAEEAPAEEAPAE